MTGSHFYKNELKKVCGLSGVYHGNVIIVFWHNITSLKYILQLFGSELISIDLGHDTSRKRGDT